MAKTALITGHQGFIGDAMMKELVKRNYRVLGVDKSSVDDAKRFFARSTDRFDLVVHCAYEVGGRAHIDGVNTALIENTLLDAMLFDWALKTKQKRVLYFSSSAAYPIRFQQRDVTEILSFGSVDPFGVFNSNLGLMEDFIDLDDIEQPDSNYGAAKLHGERLARVYAENGGRVHVVRPFSGYGESQSLDYPFPSIVRRALQGDLTVWGPKGQTRDWIHLDDVIAGSLAVVDADYREPVNLCTGRATEMGELALMVCEERLRLGEKVEAPLPVTYLEDKPTGVFYRVGDPTNFNKIYTPVITIEEGVSRAVQKYRG
jgi:nucleoside-diphosphate-sugar epimerase